MVKIGLIHGMSYRDNRIFATKETPEVVVDDMDVAKHYENTGFFKILGEAGTDTAEDDVLTKELNSKTVAELKEYASARGIDTAGLSKKADLVQHISSEQKKADEARALLRGE